MLLYMEKDCTDVINLRILRWKIILDHLTSPNIITKVLKRGRQSASKRVIYLNVIHCWLRDGGRGREPTDADGLQKLEKKTRKQILT